MRHLVIGTAGHVDHGKTALIHVLTGIDTDRLREEKERGISIELGFAYLDLPSGRRAGIVDVPGHERFIKNMLAGVGGIDLVLLVIAADEGVMPQTREHLEIIQLLEIKRGIVVLTKIDLVDEEWLELVREEVTSFLKGTVLEGAPILAVSSVTREGLPELVRLIDELAADLPERRGAGPARLPIDRVFSVTGFGTVVTGTLVDGRLRVGDAVEVLPRGLKARIRSLQVHKRKVDEAGSGQRVAVNLAGVDVSDVDRGQVLVPPQAFRPTQRLDARLELLPEAPRPLKNRARIRFYLGAAEILGRAVILDRDALDPGGRAYAQLILEEPTVAARGDRFVIRSYSPMRTIGGGTVIDPHPPRHKRYRDETIEALATLERGTPEELVVQVLTGRGEALPAGEVAKAAGLNQETVGESLAALAADGQVETLECEGQNLYMAAQVYADWRQRVLKALEEYRSSYPLREGYPKEELRSRKFSSVSGRLFLCFLQNLAQRGEIEVLEKSVRLPGAGSLSPLLEARVKALDDVFAARGFQPPSFVEAAAGQGIGETESSEYLHFLLREGRLIKLGDDLYLHRDTVERAKEAVAAFIREKGEITVGEARDLLQTSRKFALPLLEYLDQVRFTRRVGDKRKLAKGQGV
ncbi:MAG: selenocysteine-specific translation elongation factor [Thermoanaerobacterales bacterium]|nr:selenocysteine-specific translation elongation factor [Thermoanaerobacterales bacterium]